MNQPIEPPSRTSIMIMSLFTVLVFVAAAWINLGPTEQHTARHSVGFALGFILGAVLIAQTVDRARRRMVALEAARRERERATRDAQLQQLRIECDDEMDSDARA